KGSVFEHEDRGFASGKKGMEESIKFGIVAATAHPQVEVAKVNYSKAFYATDPAQVVTYCECHDNHVLWDKLRISNPKASAEELKNMHKLSLTIVLTSQGISFLHAGTEFLRSKKGVENSFESGDSINAIDWNLKTVNKDVFDYVRGLVAMRKQHPAFRMTKAEDIAKHIRFISAKGNLISYMIDGTGVGDSWKKILVVFNGSAETKALELPVGKWKAHVVNNFIQEGKAAPRQIAAYSAVVLYSK
ncbi:MAG TPA: alpha-1,6-glucosidase domain-containing protein, partial [Chitinophagaceae bacterium]|nr:alpha-1,6-glucosidase domain-containing protein [Chitinophagaceae bacterium]